MPDPTYIQYDSPAELAALDAAAYAPQELRHHDFALYDGDGNQTATTDGTSGTLIFADPLEPAEETPPEPNYSKADIASFIVKVAAALPSINDKERDDLLIALDEKL